MMGLPDTKDVTTVNEDLAGMAAASAAVPPAKSAIANRPVAARARCFMGTPFTRREAVTATIRHRRFPRQ